MHIRVQWKPNNMITNGQKKNWLYQNTPYNGLVILEQLFSL